MSTLPTKEALKKMIKGKVVMPSDHEYDNARKVFNAMIHRRPAAVVYCQDIDDIKACVRIADQAGLPLAIRGGGHNAAGLGVGDGALVVDMTSFKQITIDTKSRTAIVQSGCTLGEIDKATHEVGLALPCGVNSTTGIAGLTLGGGLGYLTRKYGLTIDNLLEAEIILANGEWVRTSSNENADLFWAIRGGGGNFGIIVSFTFQLHPISIVTGGPMLWDIKDAKEVLQWYRDFIRKAPEDLNGFFVFITVPPSPHFPAHLHLKKMCGIVWCYTGDMEKAEDSISAIRRFKTPALDFVGRLPMPALQSMFDPSAPSGCQMYWKGDYINELSDAAIDLHVEHGLKLPTLLSTMHIYPINGAASRVKNDATAWSYRDANWVNVIVGTDPDPSNNDAIIGWAKAYWNALHPYSAGGNYINFAGEDSEENTRKSYRDNYERLTVVKRKYDPKNLLRVNHNIKPLNE